MTKSLIYAAALAAALLTVLSTRFVIPALILCFKAIEQSFAPEEPTLVPALAAVPEPVTIDEPKPEPKAKPRTTRKRASTRKTTVKLQEVTA